ncbi:hypothetical protein F2Q69_00046270 [Brassica cretica]|uniref:Uncharacterized protein n=2 Tax=Brassica cretica TaxID=69181 RepID=A0A8S9PWS7_BRACR|nr:hypothetical protein DY000_02058779 [Brassica cretica]KAF3524240.1 hypothetical protein F2Q69_00046270 [Brassica cretica]
MLHGRILVLVWNTEFGSTALFSTAFDSVSGGEKLSAMIFNTTISLVLVLRIKNLPLQPRPIIIGTMIHRELNRRKLRSDEGKILFGLFPKYGLS